MKPRTSVLLQGSLLVSAVMLMGGIALAQSTRGTFQVTVSEGHLSLEAFEAQFVHIFEEIGQQAKVTIDSNIGPEETITIQLKRVPLEDGLLRLAKNVMVVYAEDPERNLRISRVVVLSEGREGAPRESQASSRRTSEKAAPRPEPFKFEFDPGKFPDKRNP
jgi:hypothetical protein